MPSWKGLKRGRKKIMQIPGNDWMLEIEFKSRKSIFASDQSSRDLLKKGFFGEESGRRTMLIPEEALYLIDVRNAKCTSMGRGVSFNDIAARFWSDKKFTARYFTYKDWRDRGLVVRGTASEYKPPDKTPVKSYPKAGLSLPDYSVSGIFFKSDLISIVDDNEKGKELYETLWFGQYGSYKAAERGQLNKLDVYESLFLMEMGMLKLNISKQELIRLAKARRADFLSLYEVYRDWREKGYVIKTGFKFGTHFRLYFPGAKPVKEGAKDWIHSKHVIHVFPRESRLLISEWARVIRVAHSVRKTFILAVTGGTVAKKVGIDFILYHRKGGDAENPDSAAPRYCMLSLSEEEYIGGAEFAGAIKAAKEKKMELIVAIADRETSVTYYKVRQIKISGSKNEYYEIDWMQP